MSDELIRQLELNGARLSARVIEEMYADPFWTERFGERGRRHAGQDGDFHVSYLVQALVAKDPDVLASYARWLRSVLTTRGMCSLHLEDNFVRLGRAITAEIPGAQAALYYLERARAALRYDSGPAREIQDAAARMATATSGRGSSANDIAYHLSYLADALALGRTELFASHVEWVSGFLQRRSLPTAQLELCLRQIVEIVSRERELSAAARVLASDALLAGQRRLADQSANGSGHSR